MRGLRIRNKFIAPPREKFKGAARKKNLASEKTT